MKKKDELLERIRGEADRAAMTLYLSKKLMAEFKIACEDIAPSKVIEELIRDFLDAEKTSSQKTKLPK